MGNSFPPLGESRTDAVIKKWLAEKGINPGDVQGYRLIREHKSVPIIELIMPYDEPRAEVAGDGVQAGS